MSETTTATAADIKYLEQTPAAFVYDSLKSLGYRGAAMGLHPLEPVGEHRLVGPVVTVRFLPRRGTRRPPFNMYDIIDSTPPGSVIVVEAYGTSSEIMGENQANFALRHGIKGFIVDGHVRDLIDLRQLDITMMCRGGAVEGELPPLEMAQRNTSINCAGASVEPGDIVVGDDDGVAFIPQEVFGEVLERVKFIAQIEKEQGELIKGGGTLEDIKALVARKRAKAK